MLRYIDICSGISAPTMAWKPLGWRALCFAEIEAAPRAVLAHHYPDVPLRGDFTEIEGNEYGRVDLVVGGTPCQDFSVAGLRAGLDGERGNLTLDYARLARRSRARWLVWENVPGVFSSNEGRDFGAVLAAFAGYPVGAVFAPPRGGWRNSGVVAPAGPDSHGLAWRVLDAQHFGVPQRRRRVFIVGYLGDWRRAAAVLLERHSLSGHPAPRREARERVAPCIDASFGRLQGCSGQDANHGHGHLIAFGGNNTAGPIDIATACNSHGGPHGRLDFESEPFIAIQERAVCENPDAGPDGAGFRTDGMAFMLEARTVPQAVAFSIMPMNSGKDFVARETDVAQPLMAGGPVGGNQGGDFVVPFDTTQITSAANFSRPKPGDPCHPLAAGMHAPAIAFPINSNALRGDTSAKTPARDAAGVVRLRDPGLGVGADGDPADTLQAAGPGAIGTSSAVRRLTPRECERLQGFPDDFTLVPNRGKPMADGPRYKMIGNSMAVPVLRWIGERIEIVEGIAGA